MQEIATVLKGAASLHGHVPGHLLHPRLIRVNGDPGDVHLAALEMDEKQHVVGHQSSQREDLHREKVGPRQHRQVSPNECRPGGRVLALRRGRQTVTAQNIADRLIRYLMPQIGQRPHDPIIAPGPILLGHANNQLLNFSVDPWPARGSTCPRSIELAGDEPSVPCQRHRDLNMSTTNIPSACRIANIDPNDAMILPHAANPGRMKFSERTSQRALSPRAPGVSDTGDCLRRTSTRRTDSSVGKAMVAPSIAEPSTTISTTPRPM